MPQTNDDIAALFERMSKLLELTGANRFRVNAAAKAARSLKDYPSDLAEIAGDKKALTAIDGVGDGTADKVAEFVRTGAIAEHDELMEKVPAGLLEVLDLPGLGPKTVKLMWDEKGVTDIDGLKAIIADGSIAELPRMGKKSAEKIAAAIEFAEQNVGRTPVGPAMMLAESLVELMRGVPGVQRAAFAGSVRRGRDTIGDVDILVSTDDGEAAREAFLKAEGVTDVLAAGERKCSVRIKVRNRVMQADLRLVGDDHFGAALMYFTGSKEHNVALRERAIARGQTLNEYGLFPDDDPKAGPPQERGIRPVAARTEEEIYEALGLPWIAPELREDRGETKDDHELPALIELADVRAELHAHTTASDGVLSIEELAEHARVRGFHTIAVTDHSQAAAIANGLSPERLEAHIEAVREANERVEGIRVLAGSEVDILKDGDLDYDDELLAKLDIVVASPHTALDQRPEEATKRLLRAIEHPLVHIIGHPCGRIVGGRRGLEPDIPMLAQAAAQHGVALEINANPSRLDLRDQHVRIALDAGAYIAIDCDVHIPEGFDNLRYGVMTGRRGGLTAESCVNAWDADRLWAWLASKR